MKKKLLDALKTKFAGVSEVILERIANKRAETVTDESQITAIVDGISFQDVLTSYGDYRANEATTSSVSNYEEKHGLKDGKPVKPADEPKPDAKKTLTVEEIDTYFNSKLKDAIKPYTDEIEKLKSEKQVSDRQTTIANTIKELGLTDSDMQFVSVPEDKDPKEYLTSYKQHLITNGLKPADPEGGAQVGDKQVQEAVASDWMGDIIVPEASV